MDELRKKTIAALEKQVELLSKDGNTSEDREQVNALIQALTGLLHELNAHDQLQPFTAE